MITRQNMFAPMIEAIPSFLPAWNEFRIQWSNEPELPLYIALGDLASHLISRLAEGETTSFVAAFSVVEQWHLNGDPYVREAATLGLLEDLQNGNLHSSTQPSEFYPWLQPETIKYWKKVEDFWSDGILINDD